MLDSVIRVNQKYYPQTLLQYCKYETKKNKVEILIMILNQVHLMNLIINLMVSLTVSLKIIYTFLSFLSMTLKDIILLLSNQFNIFNHSRMHYTQWYNKIIIINPIKYLIDIFVLYGSFLETNILLTSIHSSLQKLLLLIFLSSTFIFFLIFPILGEKNCYFVTL